MSKPCWVRSSIFNHLQGIPLQSTRLHWLYLLNLDFLELPTSAEVAEQRTDCHATDGLVAVVAPDGGRPLQAQMRTAQRGSIPIAWLWPCGPNRA